MEVILSKRFIKQAKKVADGKPRRKEYINACIKSIAKDGRKSSHFRKEMKGEFLGYSEFQVGGDLRVLARFSSDKTRVVFEQIGTHSFFGW